MSNSDFDADLGDESSDVYSLSERSSGEEEVSEEKSESSDSSTENISSVLLCVYLPEPAVNTAFKFIKQNPGVKNMPPPRSLPLVYFFLFLTREILLKIVNETKRYANQLICIRGKDLSPESRMSCWEQLKFGMDHLKRYLGLTLLLGLVKKRNLSVYWNKRFACLSTPYFAKVVSRNVY